MKLANLVGVATKCERCGKYIYPNENGNTATHGKRCHQLMIQETITELNNDNNVINLSAFRNNGFFPYEAVQNFLGNKELFTMEDLFDDEELKEYAAQYDTKERELVALLDKKFTSNEFKYEDILKLTESFYTNVSDFASAILVYKYGHKLTPAYARTLNNKTKFFLSRNIHTKNNVLEILAADEDLIIRKSSEKTLSIKEKTQV